jgi:hypothetical protein
MLTYLLRDFFPIQQDETLTTIASNLGTISSTIPSAQFNRKQTTRSLNNGPKTLHRNHAGNSN